MEKQPTGRIWILLICTGFLIVVLGTILYQNSREKKRGALDAILNDALPAVWLIGEENLRREIELQTLFKEQIHKCFARFQNNDIEELRLAFQENFFISHFLPQGASRASSADASLPSGEELEIVLYGLHVKDSPRIIGVVFYDPEWQAVFLPAMEMSFPWFCAILLHELGHARNDKVLGLPEYPFLSDGWIQEEIQMHELESAVLNDWTNGAYHETIQRIVQEKQAQSMLLLLRNLSEQDLGKVDSLFPPGSQREYLVRIAQYSMDFSLEWMRQHQETDKVGAYRTLFKELSLR
ncbi:MAG: hypothetical protein HYT50_01230 [Candidatus Wildermuthbacteria bacterium]|nr:hypothetical protein [Candidatus Wildermuthbacteria bacterium]